MGAAVRLHLDAVPAPVVARLAHWAPDRMVVTQPLPFLRLNGGVRDDDGRQARIEGVRVQLDDGTPSLVLDLVYETPALPEPFRAAIHAEDTLPGFVPEGVVIEPPVVKPRRDPTIPFEYQRAETRVELAISDPPPSPVQPSRWSRLWMRFVLWMRGAELFVDRLLAARAARAARTA